MQFENGSVAADYSELFWIAFEVCYSAIIEVQGWPVPNKGFGDPVLL